MSPRRVTKSRDSMTRSRIASWRAVVWQVDVVEGRSVFRVMRERYSKDVAEAVRIKFLA
jgi:hypothetical protein